MKLSTREASYIANYNQVVFGMKLGSIAVDAWIFRDTLFIFQMWHCRVLKMGIVQASRQFSCEHRSSILALPIVLISVKLCGHIYYDTAWTSYSTRSRRPAFLYFCQLLGLQRPQQHPSWILYVLSHLEGHLSVM